MTLAKLRALQLRVLALGVVKANGYDLLDSEGYSIALFTSREAAQLAAQTHNNFLPLVNALILAKRVIADRAAMAKLLEREDAL